MNKIVFKFYILLIFLLLQNRAFSEENYLIVKKGDLRFHFLIKMHDLFSSKYLDILKDSDSLTRYIPDINHYDSENEIIQAMENSYIKNCITTKNKYHNKNKNFYYSFIYSNEYDNHKIYSYLITINSYSGDVNAREKAYNIYYGSTLDLKEKSELYLADIFDLSEENRDSTSSNIEDALIHSFIRNEPKGSCSTPEKSLENTRIRFATVNIILNIPFVFTKSKEIVLSESYRFDDGRPINCKEVSYDMYLPIPYEEFKKISIKNNPLIKNVE